MKMTFTYRLQPTKAQRTALQGSLDACRWVYNKVLQVRRDVWAPEQRSLSKFDTIKMLPAWKAEHPFLTNAHSQALQNVCIRVDLAFQAFFRRVQKGEKPGYPRFKSRYRYDSFTFPQYGNGVVCGENGTLRLSKIGHVKVKMHRPIRGDIKAVIIHRDAVGNWYACFTCEVEPQPLEPTSEVVGIDLGLTKFATLSNGEIVERQRWMQRDAKDIKRLQRKVARLAKGSSERRKAVLALRHAYQRQTNRRKDFAHQLSRTLVNRFQILAVEKLNIRAMQSNGNRIINAGIADVAWHQLVQFTSYKAEDAGRTCVLVDPKHTTQQCSGCGEIVAKDLAVRKHECPHCGLTMDRDHNAALNILARGLASLSTPGAVEAHGKPSGS